MAAEDRAASLGYSVIAGNSNDKKERETGYLNLFEQLRVRGILISPVGNVLPRLRHMRERGISSVLVDRKSPDLSFSSVSLDDVEGGSLAVSHLIGLGRTRIMFVGGPAGIRQVADRLKGARQAAQSHPDAVRVASIASLSRWARAKGEARPRVGTECLPAETRRRW